MREAPRAPDARGQRDVTKGTAYGATAYLIWGVFPLYFPLLKPAGAVEILLHRMVWSLVVCALVLTVIRGWREVATVLRVPKQLALLAVAATVVAINWGVYIYGVNSAQVVEASLGYFINPLVTVLLGVVVLHERLRAVQWVAVGIGALAVVVLAVDYGRPPWIALTLAFSFGIYGLAKNRVGRGVGALASLSIETGLLAPLALAALVTMELTGDGTFTNGPPLHPLLLASTGVVTAVPLLFFAAAARRVPLTTIGLLQYLNPVLQFAMGVVVLGEEMPTSRWFGFAAVWLALIVLSLDSLRTARSRVTLARAAQASAGAVGDRLRE